MGLVIGGAQNWACQPHVISIGQVLGGGEGMRTGPFSSCFVHLRVVWIWYNERIIEKLKFYNSAQPCGILAWDGSQDGVEGTIDTFLRLSSNLTLHGSHNIHLPHRQRELQGQRPTFSIRQSEFNPSSNNDQLGGFCQVS